MPHIEGPTAPDAFTPQLAAVDTFDTLRELTMSWARLIGRAAGATFVLRDGDNCFYVDEDAVAPLWRGQRFPLTGCISGWAMLHAEPAVVTDIMVDERIPLEAYRPTFVRSLVAVPMGSTDPVGAIGLYWTESGHGLPAEDLATLQRLGHEVGDAVRRLGIVMAPWAPNFALREATRPVGEPVTTG